MTHSGKLPVHVLTTHGE